MGSKELVFVFLFCFLISSISGDVSTNYGLCNNPECSAPIAKGLTSQRYQKNQNEGLSFAAGIEVDIYVRDYGEKNDMFGIEINKKRGYVSKSFIKETATKIKDLVPALGSFLETTNMVTMATHSESSSSPETSTSTQTSLASDSVLEVTSQSQFVSPSYADISSPSSTTNTEQLSATKTSAPNIQPTESPSSTSESNQSAVESSSPHQPISASTNEEALDKESVHVASSNDHSPISPSFSFSTEGSESNSVPSEISETSEISSSDVLLDVKNQQVKTSIKKALNAVSEHLAPSSNDPDDMAATMALIEQQGLNADDVTADYSSNAAISSSGYTETNTHFSSLPTAKVPPQYDVLSHGNNIKTRDNTVPSSTTKTKDIISDPVTKSLASSDMLSQLTKEESGGVTTESPVVEPPIVDAKTDPPLEDSVTNKSYEDNKEDSDDYDGDEEGGDEEDGDGDDSDDMNVDNFNTKESKVIEKESGASDQDEGASSEANKTIFDHSESLTNELKDTAITNQTAQDIENEILDGDTNPTTQASRENSDLKDSEFSSTKPEPHKNSSATDIEKSNLEFEEFNETTDKPTPPSRQILSNSDSTPSDIPNEPNNLGEPSSSIDHENSALLPEESTLSEDVPDTSSIFSFIYIYEILLNSVTAISNLLDAAVLWIPEPVHVYIDNANISSRAVVFTGIAAFPCALLLFAGLFLKERSKEQELIDLLRETEHQLYLASTERNILREETKTLKEQLTTADDTLDQEKNTTLEIQQQLTEMQTKNKDISSDQVANLDLIQELQENETNRMACIKKLENSLELLTSDKIYISSQLSEALESFTSLTRENEWLKQDCDTLKSEKEQLENVMSETDEKNKNQVSNLEQSCAQLLTEAVDWNSRVNELTDQLYSHASLKEELERNLTNKDLEITTLKTALSNVEALQNTEDDINDNKTLEDKIKELMDVSTVQNELRKTEEMRDSLAERLQQEKNKIVKLEVDMMELKSEEEKIKLNYNQALQDKTEAQTKLDVLTKYFKDKELQLQRELGVQEAVRQRKEEDATHAERRVLLIEKENESYKYQVATLKQEVEETERNLKNQIAAQEKKAHENWLAARAAERKVEDMKQETTTLRQRLTLLEREQENWLNTSQNDIVRPVPQRLSDGHELFGSHEGSISSEYMPRHLPPPPPLLDDLLPPPGRPMIPPPSARFMMPPFMPPFDPSMPLPPHRPQPWRYSDKQYDSDRRNTPSDYEGSLSRKHQTPPYHDVDRRSSSPVDGSSRSRGSSPHERLPDFHNLPPPMPRHMEFHPPGPRFIPPMTSSRIHKGLSTPPRPGNKSSSTNSHRPGSDDYRRPHPDADV